MGFPQLEFIFFTFDSVFEIGVDFFEFLFGFMELAIVEKLDPHFSLPFIVEELLVSVHIVGSLTFSKVEHFDSQFQRFWYFPTIDLQKILVVISVLDQLSVVTCHLGNL